MEKEINKSISSTKVGPKVNQTSQVSPKVKHYNKGKIEVITFIEDQNLNFSRGNVVKYVCRAGSKDDELKDLKKARDYINFEIARLEREEFEEIKVAGELMKSIEREAQLKVQPKTKKELMSIIEKTIKEFGNNVDLNFIDISKVTDLSLLFSNSNFNGDISKWDTSNATDMSEMFYNSKFNGDISKWDVSNVTDMNCMFSFSDFNGDISKWDTSNVTNIYGMFYNSKFNQDISKWDTSNVIYNEKFNCNSKLEDKHCPRFNYNEEKLETERVQPKNKEELKFLIEKSISVLGNEADLNFIDTSKIIDMSYLFFYSKFNGDISNWDTSKVTNMSRMFEASHFNGDISNWDTSKVTNMSRMFAYSKFNGDVSKWNTSKVTDMRFMFFDSKFNGDVSKWNVSKVTNMSRMFEASHFNGDISNWDTSNVNDDN